MRKGRRILKKQKSLKINFIFYAIKSAMAVLFPLISFPYASRILGVAGIGKVQYCSSIISYFALVASLGISTYAIREAVKLRDDRKSFSKFAKEIFTINLISTLFTYVVLFLCILFHLFDGYIVILLSYSLSIICTTLSVEWIYQAEEEYVYISIRTILVQFIALIFMFLFVKTEKDTLAYSLVLVFSSGGYCIFNLIHAKKYVDFGIKVKLELLKHIKSIMIIFGTNIASSIYLNLDMVMLGWIYGDYQVGLYSAAVKINVIIRGLINSISTVLLPRLSLYQEEQKKMKYLSLLRKGLQITLLFSISSAVGLICLSEEIILLFSGKDFLQASTTCCILAINLIFSTLDNVIYWQILIPHHFEKKGCFGTIIGALMNLILNALLIPSFLIEGAAIASLLSELTVFIFFLYHIRKILPISELFRETYKLLIGALGIAISVMLIKKMIDILILKIIISVVVAVILYFSILVILKYTIVLDELFLRLIYLKKFTERIRKSDE